jgi:hypothetical protein
VLITQFGSTVIYRIGIDKANQSLYHQTGHDHGCSLPDYEFTQRLKVANTGLKHRASLGLHLPSRGCPIGVGQYPGSQNVFIRIFATPRV